MLWNEHQNWNDWNEPVVVQVKNSKIYFYEYEFTLICNFGLIYFYFQSLKGNFQPTMKFTPRRSKRKRTWSNEKRIRHFEKIMVMVMWLWSCDYGHVVLVWRNKDKKKFTSNLLNKDIQYNQLLTKTFFGFTNSGWFHTETNALPF